MNQDAVLAVRLPDGQELVAVADGMGGHSAGEVASRLALETLWLHLKAGRDLRAAVAEANAAVHAAAEENPAWGGMGTTLVAMLRSSRTYEIVNVGDSRAYRIDSSSMRRITVDHSLAAEAGADAQAHGAPATPARWRNALTRAVGTSNTVEVDVFGPFAATEPHALLLCTDGVYRSLPDEALGRFVAGAADAWTAARAVVAEALRNGSGDNVSAAVVLFSGERTMVRAAQPVAERRKLRRASRVRRGDLQLLGLGMLLVVVLTLLAKLL